MSATGAAVAVGAFELAKLTLAMYFEYMRIAGKNAEEMEVTYQQSKARFISKNPDNLEDV